MTEYKYKVVKPNQIVFVAGQPVRLIVGDVYVSPTEIKGDRVELLSKPKDEPKLEVATPSAEPVKSQVKKK